MSQLKEYDEQFDSPQCFFTPLRTHYEAVFFSLFTKQDIAKSNSRTATLNKITVQIQTYTLHISNQQICKTTKASAVHHTTDAFVVYNNKELPLINNQSIAFKSTNLPR